MPESRPDSETLRAAVAELFPRGATDMQHCNAPRGERHDCEARVSLGNEALRLLIEFKQLGSDARLKEAAELIRRRQEDHPGALLVLACRFLSPARQEFLRESGVPFFDLAGNAWIVADNVHVDRRGFPNPFPEQRHRQDPFADKASLVLRALVASGPRKGVRAIAEQTGLSPGYVSKVVHELEERSYVGRRDGGLSLLNARELLQDWVRAYRRHWTEQRGYFVPATRAQAVIDALRQASLNKDYALTLQAGASLVAPYADFDVVDVYVHDLQAAAQLAGRLDAREVDRGANLRFSVPYHRVSAFFDMQEATGLPVVSDLQLYLDLYDYAQRGREQAEHILEHRLMPKIETASAGR